MPTATPLVRALIVVRLAFLTGTAEELFFRGALYGWLRGGCPLPSRSPPPPAYSPSSTPTIRSCSRW
jgi:hypothetical protein